jgi:hypothetical protein
MAKHHIVITGTGRAGTTFLMQLFTALGLDTGFPDPQSGMFANCNAGMESDLRVENAPYIVKSPNICDYLDEVVESGEVVIDHALVPMRDLFSAAESRREVMRTSDETALVEGVIPGGLWRTKEPSEQEKVLLQALYNLIYTISKRDIPMTLLFFPRLVNDPEYLYGKLAFMLPEISYADFLQKFNEVVQPDLLHDFPSRKEELSHSRETANLARVRTGSVVNGSSDPSKS